MYTYYITLYYTVIGKGKQFDPKQFEKTATVKDKPRDSVVVQSTLEGQHNPSGIARLVYMPACTFAGLQ